MESKLQPKVCNPTKSSYDLIVKVFVKILRDFSKCFFAEHLQLSLSIYDITSASTTKWDAFHWLSERKKTLF